MSNFRYGLNDVLFVEHPNLQSIIDFKEDDKKFYLIMQYFEGVNLFGELANLSALSENLVANIAK